MSSRRDFIKQASALVIAGCLAPDLVVGTAKSVAGQGNGKVRAVATDLCPEIAESLPPGVNMAVLFLDNHVQWAGHPEVSHQGSVSQDVLSNILNSLRSKGIEPIPAFNFSAAHDMWMGKYSRMLSSKPYYSFCKDLIAEAIDLFGRPRFIHFGMQDEGWEKQQNRDRIIYRQDKLWWSDLYFYISEAMGRCVRPWVWADSFWKDPDLFLKMMPRNVLLSNWSSTGSFADPADISVKAFGLLDAEGYDQIPASPSAVISNRTVTYCSETIHGEHLLGFISNARLND